MGTGIARDIPNGEFNNLNFLGEFLNNGVPVVAVGAIGAGLTLNASGTLSATAVSLTEANFAALNLSTLPTSNPGGGLPWLNSGVLTVGAG